MRSLLILFLSLFISISLSAQAKEIGVQAGIVSYQGDLVHLSPSLKGSGPALAIVYRDFGGSKIAINGSLGFGAYSGDDDNFREEIRDRQFSFETSYVNLQGLIEYYPFRKLVRDRGEFQRGLHPYVGVGLSLLFVNSEVSDNGGRIKILDEDLDAKSAYINLPFVLGLRYELSSVWSLNLSGTTHFMAGDYLDGISESGNPKADDLLFNASLGISYQF